MKTKSLCYILDKELLTEEEFEILYGIVSSDEPEYPFTIRIKDLHDYFLATLDVNGSETVDSKGETHMLDCDREIKFISRIMEECSDCEYVIVEF